MAPDELIQSGYKCPLCGRKIVRDLVHFIDYTHHHVIDKIKNNHPEWVESDGA